MALFPEFRAKMAMMIAEAEGSDDEEGDRSSTPDLLTLGSDGHQPPSPRLSFPFGRGKRPSVDGIAEDTKPKAKPREDTKAASRSESPPPPAGGRKQSKGLLGGFGLGKKSKGQPEKEKTKAKAEKPEKVEKVEKVTKKEKEEKKTGIYGVPVVCRIFYSRTSFSFTF